MLKQYSKIIKQRNGSKRTVHKISRFERNLRRLGICVVVLSPPGKFLDSNSN
jgi:hypothetical protein